MGKGYLILLAGVAAVGSFLFGYDSGVMTNIIASHNFLHYFNTERDSHVIGSINSTFNGGAAVGSLWGGWITDRWGRKTSIQFGAVVAIVGAALQAGSDTLAMLLVGRAVAGWAVGLLTMAVPIYQTECAPAAYRGLISGMAQQMVGVGFMVAAWIGFGSNHAPNTSTFQWRFPLAFQCVPAVFLVFAMAFFPESPRFLAMKGLFNEGHDIMMRLHSTGDNDSVVEAEFNEIKATIIAGRAFAAPGWTCMFTVPQWRQRLLIALAAQVFTQTTGINVISYYQTSIYYYHGYRGDTVMLLACACDMVGPFFNLIFITMIIDRVGRRKPLIIGTILITIFLALESACGSQLDNGQQAVLAAFNITWVFAVTAVFYMSYGPISWAYMCEVLPTQIRGPGVAVCTGLGNWAVATMWAQVTPRALGALVWKYWLIFVAINAGVTLPCIYLFFPETRQITLEEIDNLFGGHLNVDDAIAQMPDLPTEPAEMQVVELTPTEPHKVA
ncbi:hypothetical protein KEM52_000997 [Ascosphaera acerosa]|nr:hypothetical protein KEM52_000997 [Ascosphaera acerosa]